MRLYIICCVVVFSVICCILPPFCEALTISYQRLLDDYNNWHSLRDIHEQRGIKRVKFIIGVSCVNCDRVA